MRNLLFIAFLALFPLAAMAGDIENIRLYPVYWQGVDVGELVVKIHEQGNNFHIEAHIRSKGIAEGISGYLSDTMSDLTLLGDKISPISFKTDFTLKKKSRHIEIKYGSGGEVSYEENNPPEDRNKRPVVAKNLKDGVYDPLSAALLAREKLRQMRASGQLEKGKSNFTIPIYDGRRRSDLEFTVYGREILKLGWQKIGGGKISVIHIGFINKPVAGYTKNEIRDLPTQNPIINAYVSDDELLLPVKGDGETRIGFAYGTLKNECTKFAGCAIK